MSLTVATTVVSHEIICSSTKKTTRTQQGTSLSSVRNVSVNGFSITHRTPAMAFRARRHITITNSYSARRPSDRRRQPMPELSELDLDEQVAQIDLDPKKLLQKGDPNTYQAVISDVMPVGYFLQLPTGRVAYLPADDLGITGGLALLRRLFKEGQEITVRIVCRGGAGREIVSIKKPEFAPPSEQKTIEMMRLHFENEKKNRLNPRNRRHRDYNNH